MWTNHMETIEIYLPGAFAGWPDQFRDAFTAIHPDIDLVFHAFVPLGALAHEVLAGRVADVYVSANIGFMQGVHLAGRVPQPTILAGNLLTMMTIKAVAAQFNELADFTRTDLRIVVP